MSRKDYELIARVVRERLPVHFTKRDRVILAQRFADELGTTNPRFDRDSFVAACAP